MPYSAIRGGRAVWATKVREMLEVLDSEEVSLESAEPKETALHIAARCLGREKPINIKKFGGTPPLLDRNHPVDMPRLSRGDIPSVLRTFCPIYVGIIHKSGRDVPDVPGLALKTSPGHFPTPRHTDHQIPLRVLSLSGTAKGGRPQRGSVKIEPVFFFFFQVENPKKTRTTPRKKTG